MRSLWKDILLSFLMGMVVPWMVLNFAVLMLEKDMSVPSVTMPEETEHVKIPVQIEGEKAGDMDAYLVGVVLAEMPASFEGDALMAQAVVARTYARKAYITGGKHGDGSICRDASCCQAYLSPEDYVARGGTDADVEKVRTAVYATSGQVLTYGGELIEATYFSCSGGRTEDAAAVWGAEYPYLCSVESPGEEGAEYYVDTVSITRERLETALDVVLTGAPEEWLGEVRYTSGGGVDTMVIGGKEFRGTQLRSSLGLRSTAFTMEPAVDSVTVTTRGWGHRVGMSQYGADAMAVSGSSYQDILAHYYPGTELTKLSEYTTIQPTVGK